MLGSLPEDLEQAYLQGKLGRKKVLALARTRRKPVQEMQATDSGMQSQAAQSSGPAMTESQRQSEIDKYAKLSHGLGSFNQFGFLRLGAIFQSSGTRLVWSVALAVFEKCSTSQ